MGSSTVRMYERGEISRGSSAWPDPHQQTLGCVLSRATHSAIAYLALVTSNADRIGRDTYSNRTGTYRGERIAVRNHIRVRFVLREAEGPEFLVMSNKKELGVVGGAALAIRKGKPSAGKLRRRKRKQTVLDEDEYLVSMERIIERDFFPDLPLLRAQLAYLKALERGDERVMAVAQQEIFRQQEGTELPKTGDKEAIQARLVTAGNASDISLSPSEAAAEKRTSLSLDQFHAKHTSEDNQSFEDLVELQKERERDADLWRREQRERQEKQLLLTGSTQCETTGLVTWEYKGENSLMYHPSTDYEMSAKEEAALVAGPPKAISHENTRVAAKQEMRVLTTNGTRWGQNGNDTPSALLAQLRYEYDESDRQGEGRRASASDRLKVNDYGFVCTPEVKAGAGGMTPIVTWGKVAGTPVVLMPGVSAADGGAAYRIPATPVREKVAMELNEKLSKKSKEKKAQGRRTPSSARYQAGPRTPMRTPTPLSKAGLALLKRTQQRSSRGGSMKGDLGLKASYSGTPARRPSSVRAVSRPATPRRPAAPSASAAAARLSSNATDDLLKL